MDSRISFSVYSIDQQRDKDQSGTYVSDETRSAK
jgi:hypothetical protein